MGNKGGARVVRTMIRILDNKLSCTTMLWTCLTMGTRSPPSPSPISLRQAFAPLQRNTEDDVSGGGNAAVGPVYTGRGRQGGGREMQFAVVGDDAVVVVGGGRRHTAQNPNYNRLSWHQHSSFCVSVMIGGSVCRPD